MHQCTIWCRYLKCTSGRHFNHAPFLPECEWIFSLYIEIFTALVESHVVKHGLIVCIVGIRLVYFLRHDWKPLSLVGRILYAFFQICIGSISRFAFGSINEPTHEEDCKSKVHRKYYDFEGNSRYLRHGSILSSICISYIFTLCRCGTLKMPSRVVDLHETMELIPNGSTNFLTHANRKSWNEFTNYTPRGVDISLNRVSMNAKKQVHNPPAGLPPVGAVVPAELPPTAAVLPPAGAVVPAELPPTAAVLPPVGAVVPAVLPLAGAVVPAELPPTDGNTKKRKARVQYWWDSLMHTAAVKPLASKLSSKKPGLRNRLPLPETILGMTHCDDIILVRLRSLVDSDLEIFPDQVMQFAMCRRNGINHAKTGPINHGILKLRVVEIYYGFVDYVHSVTTGRTQQHSLASKNAYVICKMLNVPSEYNSTNV
jgi:hypothetical protein